MSHSPDLLSRSGAAHPEARRSEARRSDARRSDAKQSAEGWPNADGSAAGRVQTTLHRWASPGVRIATHAAFWLVVFGFFVLYFGRGDGTYRESLLFVSLLLPVAMATTYALTHVLVPRYLLAGRHLKFAVYALYTFVVSVYLELVVLIGTFIFLAQYQIQAMNPETLDVIGLVVALYVVVFLAVAATLAVRWHQLREQHIRSESARLEAELKLRNTELDRLKAQTHPHFLFNTLNNLYGLVLNQSDDAPEAVLQLADLLEYMLYGAEQPVVPLRSEWEHIQTYLSIERLRLGERADITTHASRIPDGTRIAPLMLIPLVENAFKHGVRRAPGTSWITLDLHVGDDEIAFEVQNSVPNPPVVPPPASSSRDASPDAAPEDAALADASTSGIGLRNLRRRLELIYPDAHTLDLADHGDRFAARLSLPTAPVPSQTTHDSNASG